MPKRDATFAASARPKRIRLEDVLADSSMSLWDWGHRFSVTDDDCESVSAEEPGSDDAIAKLNVSRRGLLCFGTASTYSNRK